MMQSVDIYLSSSSRSGFSSCLLDASTLSMYWGMFDL
ncbi:unnamed protein product [Rhodiola kirilowii]